MVRRWERATRPVDVTAGRSGAAVLMLAKAPRPGAVKTRLHPLLGPDGSAALQAELIRHAATLACAAGPTYVAFDPPEAAGQLRRLVPGSASLFGQAPGHLGRRLAAAVERVAVVSPGPIVVIGTDAPTLTADTLAGASQTLAGGADEVLGPAHDGGYYLIGLPAPDAAAFAIEPALWGGDQVLTATVKLLRAHGRRVQLLEPLHDLDTPADAATLLDDPALPPAIATLLRPSIGGPA